MSFLVHPWLLVAGICAVSLPVLIHLLNRRRFRVVDWAAMDFLLQADKQCRRRIRLQHLILLVLRSAAVVLIGLLLARPFIPSSVSGNLLSAAPFERIIVLDDSLSMQARVGNETVWEVTKRGTLNLMHRLALQQGGKDSCTLILTSQPSHPAIAAATLTNLRVDEWRSTIEELKCSDGASKFPETFRSLAESGAKRDANAKRAVYVFTDMRQVDWSESEQRAEIGTARQDLGTLGSLRQLGQQVQGCFVIDAGNQRDGNLTITRVEADGPLVSDVPAAIDVSVLNQGLAKVENIIVKLLAENGLPLQEMIPRLAPGDSSIVRFHFTFSCDARSNAEDKLAPRIESRRIRVELNADKAADDILSGDSSFYFPARVRCGIRALLVDGDPNSKAEKSESFYLQRALAPTGSVKSGILQHVVPENDLDAASFSDYDVIFLLNCNQLGVKGNENLQRLTQWVARGGRLVLMPGDQTEPSFFNDQFWQAGQGLSPLKLLAITGDPTQQAWADLQLTDSNMLFQRLASEQQTLLNNVKVFRRWQTAASEEDARNGIEVIARFNDSERSPAIALKPWGTGRVVAFAIPADADWHSWPSSPSYIVLVQELVHTLVGNESNRGLLHIGEAIHQPLDLAQFEPEANVEGPEQSTTHITAVAPPAAAAKDSAEWQLTTPVANRLGFYELSLSRRDGVKENSLFAANADPSEGDLKRVDLAALQSDLTGTNVRILSVEDVTTLSDTGVRAELWRYLAWLLVAVLATEQALGWLFGRDRT